MPRLTPLANAALAVILLMSTAAVGQEATGEEPAPVAEQAAADDGIVRIYISADMEGLAGAVTGEQLGTDGFEYERFRKFMTDEVNAAIDAARAAGADEFLISDSHGNGQSLLIEELPDDVMIVRSWPRPLGMMDGIDETFDGVIFLGYHSSTSNSRGVRAHTMSSANVTELRLNGVAMSEGSLNAAIAGSFGVPVILVTGDDVAVAETQVIVGDVEGAVVKWARGFHSARTLTPQAAQEVIRTRTASAISRIDDFEPYVLEPPIEVELSLKHYRPVELLDYLPNVERVNSHTVRFVAEDMEQVSQFLTFVLNFRVDMQP